MPTCPCESCADKTICSIPCPQILFFAVPRKQNGRMQNNSSEKRLITELIRASIAALASIRKNVGLVCGIPISARKFRMNRIATLEGGHILRFHGRSSNSEHQLRVPRNGGTSNEHQRANRRATGSAVTAESASEDASKRISYISAT